MKNDEIFVWVQTNIRRDPTRALANIEASDVGKNYTLACDNNQWTMPRDHEHLQQWWEQQWLLMAKKATAAGCQWILRLEDDIAVNEHILHNTRTWTALDDPDFGMGTLFNIDYWLNKPHLFRRGESGGLYRKTFMVEGAQAQVLPTTSIPRVIALAQKIFQSTKHPEFFAHPWCPRKYQFGHSFDWCLSKAVYQYGQQKRGQTSRPYYIFIHNPSLVNVGVKDKSYWANNSFDASWKRNANSRETSSLRGLLSRRIN